MSSAQWIFDPTPPSGERKGGLASAYLFDPSLDSFVREVLQNSRDQRLDGECARVRFCLRDVSGPELDALLAVVGWPDLQAHVTAAAGKGNATLGHRLKRGLTAVDAGRLRVLLVEDRNTKGLVGEEFAAGENFADLTRHELVTQDRLNSGGSFGLGKSVLWRFSMLSTVLFNSVLVDGASPRFIGRTLLSGHETDGGASWAGSGWFGALDLDTQRQQRAVSLRGANAVAAVSGTLLVREPGDTGTSALIIGFDDPAEENEPAVRASCEAMLRSATKWFWPTLRRGELEVTVEGWEGDELVFPRTIAPPEDDSTRPFIDALALDLGPPEPISARPGVYEWEIGVDVPRMVTDGSVTSPNAEVHAVVRLRAALGGPGADTALDNTVALTRGSGMVIAYQPVTLRPGVDGVVHAVLEAGEAHGAEASDRVLERFLRAAEPPAHEKWTHKTERVRGEYTPQNQVRVAIDGINKGVEEQLRELSPPPPDDSDDGPDAFKRLFPLVSGGEREQTEQFFLRKGSGRLVGDAWAFAGEFERNPKTEKEKGSPWAFRVRIAVAGEGRPETVEIAEFMVEPPGLLRSGGGCIVDVPADQKRVAFSGRTEPLSGAGVIVGQERRVRGRLMVSRVDPE